MALRGRMASSRTPSRLPDPRGRSSFSSVLRDPAGYDSGVACVRPDPRVGAADPSAEVPRSLRSESPERSTWRSARRRSGFRGRPCARRPATRARISSSSARTATAGSITCSERRRRRSSITRTAPFSSSAGLHRHLDVARRRVPFEARRAVDKMAAKHGSSGAYPTRMLFALGARANPVERGHGRSSTSIDRLRRGYVAGRASAAAGRNHHRTARHRDGRRGRDRVAGKRRAAVAPWATQSCRVRHELRRAGSSENDARMLDDVRGSPREHQILARFHCSFVFHDAVVRDADLARAAARTPVVPPIAAPSSAPTIQPTSGPMTTSGPMAGMKRKAPPKSIPQSVPRTPPRPPRISCGRPKCRSRPRAPRCERPWRQSTAASYRAQLPGAI